MSHFKVKFKTFLILGLVAVLVSFVGFRGPAEASTLIFKSKKVEVSEGQTFVLPVRIDTAGERHYTVRLALKFPSDLVTMASFQLAKDWLAVDQPGYDLVDQAGGRLLKTAGWPGGFSGDVLFGTLTFRAKKGGEGSVSAVAQSFVLNEASDNTLSVYPQLALVISSSSPVAASSSELAADETLGTPPEAETVALAPLFDIEAGPGSGPAETGLNLGRLVTGGLLLLSILMVLYIIMKKRRWKNKSGL